MSQPRPKGFSRPWDLPPGPGARAGNCRYVGIGMLNGHDVEMMGDVKIEHNVEICLENRYVK